MKKIVAAFLLIVPCMAFSMTGNELLKSCKLIVARDFTNSDSSDCMPYVDGVLSGFYDAILLTSNGYPDYSKKIKRFGCIPDGVTRGQTIAVIVKHLESNPEHLHKDAQLSVISGIAKAFPCNEKEK